MKKIFTLIAVMAATLGMQAKDTWTVAGVSALCGSSWNPADASNDMVEQTDGTFKWEKAGCAFEAEVNYEFKVVKNHAWGEEYPSTNYIIKVAEDGAYTVVITFDPATTEVNATYERTGDVVIGEKIWTVAGVEALLGVNWDPAATENDMVKQSDGSYKLVKTGVALLGDTEYEYKVAANHAWDESYGLNGGGANAFVSVTADGTYDVTFVFNPNTAPKTVEATASPATSIASVELTVNQNAPRYDLSGRQVTEGYRGVVIQNGKKVVVK